MAFKTDEFVSALNKTGVAKSSHFKVHIHGRGDSSIERELVLRADTAELPGRTISTNEYRIYDSFNPFDPPAFAGEIYEDNYEKLGWYVENIKTDMQEGEIPMFVDKENKWFNNISGLGTDANLSYGIDSAEFSLQGLGNGNATGLSPSS